MLVGEDHRAGPRAVADSRLHRRPAGRHRQEPYAHGVLRRPDALVGIRRAPEHGFPSVSSTGRGRGRGRWALH